MLGKVTLTLLTGFGQNAIIFFVTLILALPLGLLIAFAELRSRNAKNIWDKIVGKTARIFVWLIRGTPLMLQLFVVFYVPGLLFGMPFRSRLAAALIAFVINYSAYFAEIYRGAIENIPRGQYEAGQALGLTKKQVFSHVILLQVVKNVTAPIGNEIITLVKDTSLARVIAVPEILIKATEFSTQGLVWVLFYTGAFFLFATAGITLLFRYIEERLEYVKS